MDDLISHELPKFGKVRAVLAITTVLGAMDSTRAGGGITHEQRSQTAATNLAATVQKEVLASLAGDGTLRLSRLRMETLEHFL